LEDTRETLAKLKIKGRDTSMKRQGCRNFSAVNYIILMVVTINVLQQENQPLKLLQTLPKSALEQVRQVCKL
jgi:hypothetical protein